MRNAWTLIVVLVTVTLAGCGQSEAPQNSARTQTAKNSVDRSCDMSTESADDACDGSAEMSFEPSREEMSAPMPSRDAAGEGIASEVDIAMPSSEPTKPKSSRKNRHIQSGTLTAGSFDDVERFEDYCRFFSQAIQNDSSEKLPRVGADRRVMIRVRNAQGQPVGGVHVWLGSQDERPDSPVEVTTASDGRAMFLPELDSMSSRSYVITVQPTGNMQAVETRVHMDQTPWEITLPDVESTRPARLDLALVIDTTGSMGDELEYLKVEIDSIAETIHSMFPNVDQRYALVVYRDQGDAYVTRSFDFTGSLEEFRSTLSNQSAGGGGDYPEAVHVAMEQTGQLDWRDGNTARVAFLVADAPPHDTFAQRTLDAIRPLRSRGVRIFPVASSGVQLKAEFVFRATAFMTMGQYLFLTDHSGVGNPHAKPHVPEYQVERLDRLMVRMIASELAAKRLVPAEVIAIEGGEYDFSEPQQVPFDQQQQTPPPETVTTASFTSNVMPRTPLNFLRSVSAWWITGFIALGALALGNLVLDSYRS